MSTSSRPVEGALPALAERLRYGSTTSVEHVRQVLDRLDALASTAWANLVAARDDERALRDARAADTAVAAGAWRSPLHGVAVAVKDNIDVEGMPTRAGSAALADAPEATSDAEVVARLRRAGAVVVAKTHLHELAYGPTGTDNAAGPAHNPHDPQRITGGSSSGSAALVALGVVPLALGTDTGCSVRVPASLCGVVGLMPTLGRLPTTGVVPLSTTLDHVGLLAPDLPSVAVGFAALATSDEPTAPAVAQPADTGSTLGDPESTATVDRGQGRTALRIGLPLGGLFRVTDPGVVAAVEAAAETLRRAGATVVPVELPSIDALAATYPAIVGAEAYEHHRTGVLARRAELLEASTRERLLAGARSAGDYRDALRSWTAARARVLHELAFVDALLLATAPFPAPLIGQLDCDGEPVRAGLLRLCVPFSVLGTPAVSVPGARAHGLPVGVQLVGISLDEPALLALAALLTQP